MKALQTLFHFRVNFLQFYTKMAWYLCIVKIKNECEHFYFSSRLSPYLDLDMQQKAVFLITLKTILK